MTFLLTGATGFIGRRLVGQLLRDGHSVNYLARQRSGSIDSRAAFHIWDRGTEPRLESVPRLDAVIHLAGEPVAQRWTAEVKQRIRESRVDGTRKLVAAIASLKHKPSVFVSTSAVGFYGDRGEEILSEESAAGQGFLADVCKEWEREAMAAGEFGLRVVLLRVATVLGKNGGALKPMLIPFKLGIGGRFGSGKQWMPWIHLDDLVALYVFAAQNASAQGPLNASAPEPVRNEEFTKTLGRVLGRPTLIPAPRFALRAALGELADFVLSSQRVIPEATERAGFQFRYCQLEPALRAVLSA
ncbi:MAG: TIGR01777 family oxidoreductase [Bryobacteraceae bacterium]